MRRCFCLAAAVCFGLVSAWAPAEDEPQYDVTAADSTGLPHLLIHKAKTFALEHPKSPAAPRAGLDWYIAATATDNEAEKHAAKVYLLLEHPTSVAGAFIFRTFPNGGELAKMLVAEFEREERHLTQDFLVKYIKAFGAAPGEIQGAVMSDPHFLLSIVFAHQQTIVLPEAIRKGFRKHLGEKHERLFDLIVDKDLSVADKLVHAQEFNDTTMGRAIQRGWFVDLWSKELIDVPEYRLYAENMLYGKKWSHAIPWIEKIPADARDSQVSFWRGWTLAAMGHVPQGLKELEQLTNRADRDEWTATAANLVGSLKQQQELNDEFAKRLTAIRDHWKRSLPEVLELRLRLFDGTAEGPASVEAYVGLDTTCDHFELFVTKLEKPLVAFRTQGPRCSLMTTRHPSIASYEQGAMAPLFSSRIVEAEGQFQLNFNFNMQANGRGLLSDSLKSLFRPVLESDGEWMARIAASLNRQGQFLLPRREGESQEFVWIAPRVEKPQCDYSVLRLNDRGLVSLSSSSFKVEVLRMGAADGMPLSPPTWPDLPTTNKQQLELSELMAIVGVLGEITHSGDKNAK